MNCIYILVHSRIEDDAWPREQVALPELLLPLSKAEALPVKNEHLYCCQSQLALNPTHLKKMERIF